MFFKNPFIVLLTGLLVVLCSCGNNSNPPASDSTHTTTATDTTKTDSTKSNYNPAQAPITNSQY